MRKRSSQEASNHKKIYDKLEQAQDYFSDNYANWPNNDQRAEGHSHAPDPAALDEPDPSRP